MHKLLLASAFAAVLPFAAYAAPITYDAVAQFSTASNPNGVWSYGYGMPSAAGVTFTAFTTANSNYGSPAWNLPSLPLVGQSYTGGTVAVPTTDLWLHPGDQSNAYAAILRFTAPVAGSYSLSALFERADNANGAGDGVGVSVYDNNTQLTRTVLPTTYLASTSFSTIQTLAVGDTLSFVVDRNGQYNYDSTGLRLSVTGPDSAVAAIPEPATFALLGAGLFGFAILRRRRV